MKKSLFFILTLFFICLINISVSQDVQVGGAGNIPQPSVQPQQDQGTQQPKKIDDSLVVNLDTHNIDSHLSSGIWMIKFFAPWCKHSQEFHKTFSELSHLLKEHIKFGQVDCINDPMLLHRFEITAYPTLKLLYKGILYEFQGERTVQQIVSFLENGYKSADQMEYPLIDQQEILKKQLELQYRDGLTAEQARAIEDQIKRKQNEIETKKKQKQYLEDEHDHDEEREIREYNERMNRKMNMVDGMEGVQPTNSTTSPLIDSIKDSKLVYALIGSLATGLVFMIKKRINRKSKFMKIA
ncbi:hypothetical protein DICPUDRAFT_92995 [Dictyostelium purpureum]|uniref:Thioredoxin domain-containing protein n=1 Tax=Dictyostelium purpureum TaxID=5786 RepID=F1A0G4_DICPU|nr:uncharacterized protein DICPUDRAFT_92995 [Dictyostelium purpureum]EGC30311.1 hypothetical protein DICPUDRAFT_92995 [Dictyostelium purpureum]|eukprot:XP_003293162.1 hypothetical protein DICPUDRAFT_92995 [Dictyostelium purpureum]